jgi:uroporphyrin-III C-methyltransferase
MSRPVRGGCVYLVGAGPGDPELLTLRAAGILAAAGAVFHDQLVSPEVLERVSPGAELVDVGHRAGQARHEVDAVVERMAERARRGMVVARLKGGDPFVFGRGGEELQRLLALGVPCEVVPGVSSALAGPAAAGIPVTHRGVATSLAIVTGHERDPEKHARWENLRADTVVVLMAAGRLPAVSRQMIEAGWDPDTPAAVVMSATTALQRQVTGRLAEIAEAATRACLGSPSILVAGEVVSLSAELAERALSAAGETA